MDWNWVRGISLIICSKTVDCAMALRILWEKIFVVENLISGFCRAFQVFTLNTEPDSSDITYMKNALYLTNHMTVSSYHILKIDLATGNESLILSTSSRLGGITNDGQHLYVSLPFSRRIVKIDLSAPALTNTIGSGATGNSDGIGLSATLSAPSGLFFKNDEIFFASLGSHNIRKFNINNLEVTTLLGNNK
ncbi:MAG: hypothetical protein JNM24_10140 [Bdellovibrionaceae bacterium]|nr:hypothetical protein [Pseudobdellovibrionaceae bacterium]